MDIRNNVLDGTCTLYVSFGKVLIFILASNFLSMVFGKYTIRLATLIGIKCILLDNNVVHIPITYLSKY